MNNKIDLYKILGIPLTTILLIFIFILLEGMTSLRIKELKINLQRIGADSTRRSNMALLAKHKQLQNGSTEKTNNDLSEMEVMSILANKKQKEIKIEGFTRYLETPILFVVNTLSSIFGSPMIKNMNDDKRQGLLILASFYERKRYYLKAIKIFSINISFFEKERDKIAFSFLHRGFCFAMLGENKRAKQDYEATIALRKNHEEGAIAELLLQQLVKISKKVKQIKKKKDSVDKGLDYYQITTYTKAIQVFNKIEKKEKTNEQLYFYRGRAYEEIGFIKNAVKDYQEIIKKSPQSTFAKKAYRRLYILGAYYEGNQKLKEKAEKRLTKLGDNIFIKKSQNIEKVAETTLIAKLPKTKSIQEAAKIVEEEINVKISQDIETPRKQLPKSTRKQDKKDDDNFLASLSDNVLQKENQNIKIIKKEIQKIEYFLKRNKEALKKEKKQIQKNNKQREEEAEKSAKQKKLKALKLAKEKAKKSAKQKKLKALKLAKEKAEKSAKQKKLKALKLAKEKAEKSAKQKKLKALKLAKEKAEKSAKQKKLKALKLAKEKAEKSAKQKKLKALKLAKEKAEKSAKQKKLKALKLAKEKAEKSAKQKKLKALKLAKEKAEKSAKQKKLKALKLAKEKAEKSAKQKKLKALKLAKEKAEKSAKQKKLKALKLAKEEKKLIDPRTTPEKRKQILKKLYKKVTKIITSKGNLVGHITQENSYGLSIITTNGKVKIKRSEIRLKLCGESKDMLK